VPPNRPEIAIEARETEANRARTVFRSLSLSLAKHMQTLNLEYLVFFTSVKGVKNRKRNNNEIIY